MTPCHTQNHGKHYRYHASIPRDGSKEPAVRLPAEQLEQAVIAEVAGFLSDPNQLQSWLKELRDEDKQDAIATAGTCGQALRETSGADLKRRLFQIGLQVTVGKKSIKSTLDLASAVGVDEEQLNHAAADIEIPTTSSWNGHEARLRLDPPISIGAKPNDALVELIARAFEARETLLAMDNAEVGAMPVRHRRHLERTAKLSYLAPDVVLAIINGTQPSHLSARKLVRAAALPLDWAAQRQIILAS